MYRLSAILMFLMLFPYILSAQVVSESDLQTMIARHNDSVSGVIAFPDGNRFAVSLNFGQQGQIVVMSLQDCAERLRFTYSAPISNIMLSQTDLSAVWGTQGDSLKKWNLTDGREMFTFNMTEGEPIIGVAKDTAGEFVAAWSKRRFVIAKLSGDNASVVWRETANFDISAAALDFDMGFFFIAGQDGTLLKRNTQGRMVNSFPLGTPVKSMIIDSARRAVLLGMGNRLMRFDIDNSVFTVITTLPADEIQLSADGKTLAILGSGSFTTFSYPSLKVNHTKKINGNKLLLAPNGGAITYDNNTIDFFDSSKQQNVGRIFVLDGGAGFLSHDLFYNGNDRFVNAILSGNIEGVLPFVAQEREPNSRACADMRAMLTSVYTPAAPATATTPRPPAVSVPAAPSVGAPSAPAAATATQRPDTPAAPAQSALPNVAAAPTPPASPTISGVSGTSSVVRPEIPTINIVAPPNLAPGADIPSWVMRPASLPQYSAVRSGRDVATALNEARARIRDDIARNTMRNMLEVQLVKDLPSDELTKRFLWQVAGHTAQKAEEYIVQRNLWVSPDGVYYVLAQIDTASVDQIYEPIFQEEMNHLTAFGEEDYMRREPVRWQ